MSLLPILNQLVSRFTLTSQEAARGQITIGFVTPERDLCSLYIGSDGPKVVEGVRDADIVIQGTRDLFQAVFDPATPNRAALIGQLRLKPDYPWNNQIIARFFQAFGLDIGVYDAGPKRFDGPFMMPLRHPVAENPFRVRAYQRAPLPTYNPDALPLLVVDDHPEWVAMYRKAWEIAFKNLREPEPESGFVANFIDTAFNDNTFMWDSCFMMMFGRYARRVFHFLGTLENFYAKQHDDGFICREISTYGGRDLFMPLDPRSTGPNILAWTEWMDYQLSQDAERLRDIFPALVGYHRWWRDWRTWPDGSYFTSGWGSGMDNQTRVPESDFYHRHYSWVDATMQQALNCQMLLNVARVIGRDEFNQELEDEYERLRDYINTRMWDEVTGFYYDVAPDGSLGKTKSVGVYWGLLSDVVPDERARRMIAYLEDPAVFNRPHRVPTQAFDSEAYNPDGGYWLGGVWAPTNYMVLRALTHRGYDDLAYAIARNHVQNVAQVFQETGTLWENYAPEEAAPGQPARPDFVGWTGISAVSVPIEYVVGLRTLIEREGLLWDIRLTERHGVLRYPLGKSNVVDLICESRADPSTAPRLQITTAEPLHLVVRWGGQTRAFDLMPGAHVQHL